MNRKVMSIALALACLTGSAAFAGALDEPATMRPFYHDKAMKKMKTGDEFAAVVHKLTPKKLKRLSGACHEDASGKRVHTDFCSALDTASGAKAGQPDTGSSTDTNSDSD